MRCPTSERFYESVGRGNDVEKVVASSLPCVLTKAGTVHCCGEPCNARPTEVAGISNAKGVAAGRWNACAWTEAGALYCWGRNDEGVVGNGRFSSPVYAATAVTGLGSGVTDVALNLSGFNHACAITSAGAAFCWGGNNLMQLGHANTNDPATQGDLTCADSSVCNPVPKQIMGLP